MDLGSTFKELVDEVNKKAEVVANSSETTTATLSKLKVNGTNYAVPSGGGGSVTVDSALSTTSTNPVQNKVITEEINDINNALQNDYQKIMHLHGLGSVKESNFGSPVEYISLYNGANLVVNYPYKQLKTAKVVSFGSGKPNTTVKLSTIVGQPTMDYNGDTEDTDALPTDNEAIFEVYLDCWFYGTNSANIYIKSNLYGISSNTNSRQAVISGYCRFGQNSFVMPISKGGSITISGDASVTSGTVTIYGYRRIR